MLVSCDSCPAVRRHCEECSLGSMMAQRPEPAWDGEDFRVMDILVGCGLVSFADAAEATLERTGGLRLLAAG